MSEQTVKCSICGEPYNVYPFYSGNQSACQDCRTKAYAKDKPIQINWCTCQTTSGINDCPQHGTWNRQ